jgi:hypothetical protein
VSAQGGGLEEAEDNQSVNYCLVLIARVAHPSLLSAQPDHRVGLGEGVIHS